MLFNSLQFLIFFLIVTSLYFALPHRLRWVLLLTASCYFYMAFVPVYILILGFTIVIDYIAGIAIENSTGTSRKRILVISLFANIGVLFVFKYFNFVIDTLNSITYNLRSGNLYLHPLNIILPIGLSFHTFQAMSYTIEVYRGKQKAERHFGIYALYVMFYPQLVAGPIERPQNLLHQFYKEHKFDYQRITDGLKLMVWGLFKKMVIADRLAVIVDRVYSNPTEHHGPSLLIATIFFSFQIYCDFSGYSDIAIGAAQVMGFKLMDNFKRPYFSTSIAEFWSRWHISLSTWFKDYVYIPLGGNRVPIWRWQINLVIVFLISGLWHGASWTFVIWGALHAFYMVVSIWTHGLRAWFIRSTHLDEFPKLLTCLQIAVTFSLVSFAWIFFRAENLSIAFYIVTNLFTGYADLLSARGVAEIVNGVGSPVEITLAIALLGFLELIHFIQQRRSVRALIAAQPVGIKWGMYYLAIMSIIVLAKVSGGVSQFIYFQF